MLAVAVARSSSDDNTMSYVLPVAWMTSCFHIMSHTERGAGSNDLGAGLNQVDLIKISNVFARNANDV